MTNEAKKEENTGKTDESVEKAEDVEAKKEVASDEAKESAEETKEPEKKVQESANEAKETGKEVKEEKKEEPKPQSLDQAEEKEIKVSGKLAGIIKDIEGLSVLELSDLVKALENKFGVTAAAPLAVAGGTTPGAGEEDEGGTEEGQTSFNVILSDGGTNKIGVIKAVRELVPSLGLKEAKDLVDAAPKQVLEGAGKDAANEAKQKLEAAGGKVELQ